MNETAKLFIIGGIILVVVGLFWQFGSKYLPLGKLPGDIAVEKEKYGVAGNSILHGWVLNPDDLGRSLIS